MSNRRRTRLLDLGREHSRRDESPFFSSLLGQGPGSSGNQDLILLCYDPAGVLKWNASHDNHWGDTATALAVAPDGSIYALAISSFGAGVSDVLLLKYSGDGSPTWTRNFHGGWGTDWGVGLGVDAAGNVLIGGNAIAAPGGTNFDWLGLKYDPAGNLLWSRNISGAAAGWPNYCWGMAVDAAGALLLTGYLVNSAGVQDFTTAKLDGSGNVQWIRSLGLATGGGEALATDAARNVIAAGGSQIASYEPSGNLRWSANFMLPGLLSADVVAIAADSGGRIVVTGTAGTPCSGTGSSL